MAEAPKKESTVLRSADGIFYEIPNAELKKYAVPPDQLKSVLAEAKKIGPPMQGGKPGGGARMGGSGGPLVINVNLGDVLRGAVGGPGGSAPVPGAGAQQGVQQGAEAGTGAVAGYDACGHSCYRSCYRSCYTSCYRSCYRSCCR